MAVSAFKSSESLAAISRRPWFQSLSPVDGKSLRLFCFPYAGGNTSGFRIWQRHFPPDIDLCLVHLPGRGKRTGEQMFTRLTLLVQTLADLITREPQPPYALFGHSMGALISFELARELRRRGFAAPQRLLVSGHAAPNLHSGKPPIFNLPEESFIEEIRKMGGTARELLDNPEAMRLFCSVLRADFEMVDTYEYRAEEPLSCPITVYSALQDSEAPVESLHVWQEHTSASCKVRMFPGDHFFIHSLDIGFVDVFQRDVLDTAHP
jgi:medium-chain acyl-[acyl-carrier-protein] hydrolase